MSEAAKLRCTPEWRAAKSKAYTHAVNASAIKKLYESGKTLDEVAKIVGVSRKVISRVMRQEGVKARKPAKRDQWGPKNHMWKGDSAKILPLHRRLYRRFGQPSKCDVCGTDDEDKTYDWANLSGKYTDTNDFKRMCRSCHSKFDGKIRNLKGWAS